MIAIECPGCKKQVQAAPTHAGKSVRCPACRTALAVPLAAPRTPSKSKQPERPARKRFFRSSTFLYGVALIGMLAVAGMLFKRQDSGAKDLWEKAKKRITTEIDNPEGRGIAIAIARMHHGKAVDAAIPRDLRGRRTFAVPDESEYQTSLWGLVEQDLRVMNNEARLDANLLDGFWERLNHETGTRYLVHLRSDGTYRDIESELGDHDYSLAGPPGSGTWRLQKNVLTWRADKEQDDPNPIVRWSYGKFVLREMDGRYNYFRQITPSTRLATLLK